jgi:hypothetical protein
MPQVIVVDEIGTELEANAARTIAQRGVQLVATAHGHELQNLVKNPALVGLVGGVDVVTLGDEEARRRGVSKTVLERQGPPTFTVAVEMLAIGYWRVHLDVGAAVDDMLAGKAPLTQIRRCGAHGAVIVEQVTTRVNNDSNVVDAAPQETMPQSRGRSVGGIASAPVARVSEPISAVGAVKLYCHGIDADAMDRVIGTLRMHGSVVLTALLDEADAVLALRSRIGRSGADDWLRITARQRGVPLYAIKEDTLSSLVRAVQTIVGPVQTKRWSVDTDTSSARSEEDAAPRPAATPADEVDALEEARLAVERVVIPQRQPVELLPRPAGIRDAQEALIATYQLVTEVTGAGSATRLRILPEYKDTSA